MEAALVRELSEELGTEATIARFLGAVECGYIEDGTAHHEVNLVFEVAIADAEPVSQEDHLEFHWLPLDQLADTDVRPGTLKTALVTARGNHTPFWHGWESLSTEAAVAITGDRTAGMLPVMRLVIPG